MRNKTLKFLVIGAVVLGLGFMSLTAYAASEHKTPAEIVAALTGRTVESVEDERYEGETYGAIANEAGVLTEFKEEMLALKKEALEEQVALGNLTQEEADEILAIIRANMENCDGTGANRQNGCGLQLGAGNGKGMGQGSGMGQGNGFCGGRR